MRYDRMSGLDSALTQSNSTNWYGASKISSKSRGAKESGVRRTFPCEKPSS